MTKFIKNPIWIILFSLPVIFMTSCKDDDTPDIDPEPAKEIIIAESSTSADDAQLAEPSAFQLFGVRFGEGEWVHAITLV